MTKDFYLSKVGRYWYVRFRDPVTRVILTAVSSGISNKTEAEYWARQEYDRLAYLSGDAGMLFADWADRFFKEDCPHVTRLRLEGRHYAETTRKAHRKLLTKYVISDPISQLYLGDIRRADVVAFRARIVATVGQTRTAQLIYSVFRTIMSETLFLGTITSDPCAGIKKIAYQKKPRHAIKLPALQKLLARKNWANEAHWEMTLAAALTGMRAGEILALCWDAIDPKANVIRVIRNKPANSSSIKLPKWEKERITVYPAPLKRLLEPRRGAGYVWELGGEPLGYKRWAMEFRKVSSGLVTLHGLRHSLHTALRDAGVPDDKLRGTFGWSAAGVQDGYTHRELYGTDEQLSLTDSLFDGKIDSAPSEEQSSNPPEPNLNLLAV